MHGLSFEQIWIPFTQEYFVPTSGWNWSSGSEEEDFQKLSKSFHLVAIISP